MRASVPLKHVEKKMWMSATEWSSASGVTQFSPAKEQTSPGGVPGEET